LKTKYGNKAGSQQTSDAVRRFPFIDCITATVYPQTIEEQAY